MHHAMQNCMARMRRRSIDASCGSLQARIMDHMQRRQFSALLIGVGGAAAGLHGCAPCSTPGALIRAERPARAARARVPIRAICFDLFTLFDPRSVVEAARAVAPEQAVELCEAWRTRQFEYAWLRATAGQYTDFADVTRDALEYAARARGIHLSVNARESLVAAYSKLEPWPDTRSALTAWKSAGLRLAPLANYSPGMLAPLIEHGGLAGMFDALISTDAARTYKPDPRAYALGVSTFELEREEIAFSAFGGWDAAGARWFGYPTFWVNRLGVAREELAPAYDGTGATLAELARFVSEWA
jgi:2-haloacid dehalogenase